MKLRKVKFSRGIFLKTLDSKTGIIQISSLKSHSQYGKIVKKTKKVLIDISNPNLGIEIGQEVILCPMRPKSKRKSWKLFKVFDSNFIKTKFNEEIK